MDIPAGYRFAKSHEWVRTEGGLLTVGLSDFAQHELGDIVFVELPPTGSKFKAGETFGVVESVKAASDLYMPVAGEVVEANPEVTNEPALVNQDPWQKGWLVKIKPASAADAAALMDEKAYAAWVAGEGGKH